MKKDEAERIAEFAESVAAEHGESCPVNGYAKAIAAAVRASATESGPAQVATPTYRSHWTSIFGKKTDAGEA